MIFKADFTAFDGHKYSVSRSLENLDRNYDDENYAYFIIDDPYSKEDGYFELNILKAVDAFGNWYLTDRGYVAEYHNTDETMPFSCIQIVYEVG